MKKVRVFIERGNDGSYGAYMPDDDGLDYGIIGDGQSAAEAIEDFKASYQDMKKSFEKEGRFFEEVEFEYSYDIPSFLTYYTKYLSYQGLAKLAGISAAQLSQYIKGYRHPSEKTTKKIEDALHRLAQELSQVHFI